jgi:hypothetical protein
VQFNSDQKSSNANSGLPVHLFLLLLLLRVYLLKYSRSLNGLLNIKVLHYDPVLLYYWNTEQHHGTQDVYTEYLVLVCSIETM